MQPIPSTSYVERGASYSSYGRVYHCGHWTVLFVTVKYPQKRPHHHVFAHADDLTVHCTTTHDYKWAMSCVCSLLYVGDPAGVAMCLNLSYEQAKRDWLAMTITQEVEAEASGREIATGQAILYNHWSSDGNVDC